MSTSNFSLKRSPIKMFSAQYEETTIQNITDENNSSFNNLSILKSNAKGASRPYIQRVNHPTPATK
jgi:hypothetical protein